MTDTYKERATMAETIIGTTNVNGWLPIETAPKDGAVIDLWMIDETGRGWREPDAYYVTNRTESTFEFDANGAYREVRRVRDGWWAPNHDYDGQDGWCDVPRHYNEHPKQGRWIFTEPTHWMLPPTPPSTPQARRGRVSEPFKLNPPPIYDEHYAATQDDAPGYRELLEHSYEQATYSDPEMSRLAYLSDYIFDFTTYDSDMGELFAGRALEVCAAINEGKTFDYIKDADNYRWYLLMVNMPFFAGRLEWGTSIRGAWWDHADQTLETCGIWRGEEQVLSLTFTRDEWPRFVTDMIAFASKDTP
jgi:hypothetical protein